VAVAAMLDDARAWRLAEMNQRGWDATGASDRPDGPFGSLGFPD
jgi:hypothetical protein